MVINNNKSFRECKKEFLNTLMIAAENYQRNKLKCKEYHVKLL